ncbi:MAG: RluA family pseudouridine synthase [Clostridia bacterium]|nr:RluA family pseudouridine synthase [Clostridia bacterium]
MTTENISVLYEDGEVLVVDKPVGLLSEFHATEPSVPALLAHHGREDFALTPITRLDRGVGGVMLLAKTKKAAAFLSARVADHSLFVKEYKAVIGGTMQEKEGELHDLLFKDSSKNKSFVVNRMRRGVKEASLSYRVLAEGEKGGNALSLVHVRLHTGRTHQIRVQFSSRRHPLLGDGKYGGDSAFPLALRAVSLAFPHPSGKQISCEAPLPKEEPWTLFDKVEENQ